MSVFVKSISSLLLALGLTLATLNNFAQETDLNTSSNNKDELAIEDIQQKIQLHWKKVNANDFLIKRSEPNNTIAILPVRGRQLVRIIAKSQVQFSVSNGSGLFQNAELSQLASDNYIFQNESTGLVWLRIQFSRAEEFLAYTASSPYYENNDFLHHLNSRANARGGKITRFKLSDTSNRVEKVFIDARTPYSFEINSPGVLLFRHQIDYELIDGQFDVLYQVAWQAPGQQGNDTESLEIAEQAIRNYTTRPEVGRLYDAKCLHQLGQRKDTLINIVEPGRYTFTSNQAIQAEFYLLTDKQVLLDRRSQTTPDLRASVEQITSDNEIVNNFNTYIDQNLYQDALNQLKVSEDNKQILSLIRAKHSFFKPLHPVYLGEQNMLYAYYSIYSDPELPSNKNTEFYLNENLTDAITKKISTGYFYPLGSELSSSLASESELKYELSTETFDNKLRIAVANMQPTNSEIILSYDTGEEQVLSLESSFTQINKRVNVVDVGLTILNQNQLGELATLSSEFATKKPVAPFLNSVTGLIDIPDNAKSFTVKSTDQNVWVSIAYPQRSFYRNFELDKIKDSLVISDTITQGSVDEIANFVNTYQIYKNLQSDSQTTLASISERLKNLNSQTRKQLQDWTPYFREIYNIEIKSPAQANNQIKLFSLRELTSLNRKLQKQGQHRLRRDTLLAHAHYSPLRAVREYAYSEFKDNAFKDERYRQALEVAKMLFVRYADDFVLNDIATIYQRLDHHKKAIFYSSLKPQAIKIDNLLASLFYLRQWGLFQDLVERSENISIWNNLKLYHLTSLSQYLGAYELAFIDALGYSWVNEDRFLLNYKKSEIIQSVNTLASKQVAYIDTNNSATITLKGPLKLRLRASQEFANNRYTQDKFKLQLQSPDTLRNVAFNSKPAQSWLNTKDSLVGTFGKIELNIPAGFHEYTLRTNSGAAYVYIENKRNLLGLNLSAEETVDAEFVRENASVYNRRGANRKRNIGYLKSSCRKLRRLQQRPIRTFQPVDIDLSLRDAWIDQRLTMTLSQMTNSESWLDRTLNSNRALQVSTSLSNICTYRSGFSEECIDRLQDNLQFGNKQAGIKLLAYIDRYPDADLSSYRNDVFETFEWQLQKTVNQSDGRINIDSEFLQEDNPYILALENDFSSEQLSSLFVTGTKVQGFKFAQGQKENNFEFKRLSQNLLNIRNVTINYQIDDEAVQSFKLTQSSTQKTINLNNQQSELKFWLAADSTNEYVSIFHENTDLSQLNKEYFVATPETPIKLIIKGPQRVKVVKQTMDGLRTIEEQQVAAGHQTLEFSTNDDEAYYRFFTLEPNFSPNKEKIVQFDAGKEAQINALRKYRAKRSSGLKLNPSKKLQSLSQSIDAEIYNQHKSTFDIGLAHGRSLEAEEETRDSSADQFTDIIGQYRYYSPDSNLYWSGDAKFRTGNGYNAIFGQARADWLPQSSPFQYTAYINDWLYAGPRSDINAYKLGINAAYSFSHKYNHRFTTSLAAFYRDTLGDTLNAEDLNVLPNAIWSTYKNNHKFGLSAAQNWTYNAYKDVQFYANAKLQSNEDLISFDYVQAGFGYRQLYDTASLDAGFTSRNYFNDSNRDEAFVSNRFSLAADWLFRSDEKQVFKVGFSYFNNFSAKDSAYAINFTWLNHRGNYLEDYRPGEYRFRTIRDLRLLENSFEEQQDR